MAGEGKEPVRAKAKPKTKERPTTALEHPDVAGGMRVFFFAAPTSKGAIPDWGTPEREEYTYALADKVDLIDSAISIVCQKIAAASFTVAGPTRTAVRWRGRLLRGWTGEVQKFVKELCRNDKGAYMQIVRYAPSWAVDENGNLSKRGREALEVGKDADWEVAYLAALDSRRCAPTGNLEYPVVYTPLVGGSVRLSAHQVVMLVDSPVADTRHPGMGKCAVSRCLSIGAMRGEVAEYFREAFSDMPKSGLLLLGNVHMKDYEEAMETLLHGKEVKGIKVYGGQAVLASAEITAPISAQALPFRIAPEGFDQRQAYQETKEVVATAFGIDPLELGALAGEGLGSAQQSTVMAKKSRGKFVGLVLEGLEREINTKVLPDNCEFAFELHDVEEDREQAEVDNLYVTMVEGLYKGDMVAGQGIISRDEARQMLSDRQIIPSEFLTVDVTTVEEIEDTEAEPEENPAALPQMALEEVQRSKAIVHRDGRVVIVRAKARPVLVAKQKRSVPAGRPRKTWKARSEYEERLAGIYEEWVAQAAQALEEAEPEDRERLLAGLLVLLASRLKAEGRAGLEQAFELGLAGDIPDEEDLAALEQLIFQNDQYIDASLVPDVRSRFERDISTPGFDWNRAALLALLAALAWRTQLYGGYFWAAIALGLRARGTNNPVRWVLDPFANHCETCPPKEAEYQNWDAMVAAVGIPGYGQDQCNGNCHCGVDEYISGDWVPVL